MKIIGEWRVFDDNIMRPIVWARLQGEKASSTSIPMLVDTGSDRTVFSAYLLPNLNSLTKPASENFSLTGVGGKVNHRLLKTRLFFMRDDNQPVTVGGEFAIFTDLVSSDLSVLGRDILDNFSVIVDHPGKTVLLVAPRHRYRVEIG